MAIGIDHLVIAVADLDAAAAELGSRAGLAFTAGGRHEGAGTANRIAFLADGAYLELIAVERRDEAERWPVGRATLAQLDHHGSGLATFAIVDDDLDAHVEQLRANGSSIGPVTRGSRRRPDGELVEWWTAAPHGIGPGELPFLIRHAYTGTEWGPQAMAARRTFAHPLGGPAILLRLDLATEDPVGLAARYTRELALEFWAVADLAVCTIGRHTLRLVPRREMEVPAVVTLGAALDGPRSTLSAGLRIDVEPAEVDAALAATRPGP